MAAAPIYGSVEADDAVRATFLALSSRRRRRQLAAGAIALLGLFAVNSARNAKLPTRALALTATEAAQSCPAVFGYDVVAYHLNEVRPSQAGVPGSSEYGASLSTSYGSYVFWFQNSHNRDLFVSDPWSYAPRMGGHCTASVAYVEGASKVVTGESSVPICVGEKDEYVEKTMGQAWVIVADRLYFFNCDATWIFSRPKDYVDTGSKDQLESITALAEANWLAEFGSSTDGPFNAADYCSWLMGEAKDDWAHGAGFGCTGVQEPHDSCLAAGTLSGEAWLVDPLHNRRR